MHAPFRSPVLLGCLLSLTVTIPRASDAAWSHDPYGYAPIAPSTGNQVLAQVLSDGAGGAFFLFTDMRNGTEDVYLQRLAATGSVAGGWPSTGLRVAAVSGRKLEPQIVGDGSGGVIAVWADFRSGNADIYAQRVLGNGTLAGGSWPANGLQLTSTGNTERRPELCTDGSGGALIAWENSFSLTDTDIFGAHVTNAGSILFDQSLDFANTDARQISLTSDTVGGFFVTYQDSSSLFNGHSRIFGLHTNGSGTMLQGPSNIIVTGPSYTDVNPRCVPDGSGGFYVVYMDNDTHVSYDLYSRHFAGNMSQIFGGTVFTSWGLDLPDFNAIADGAGGFIFSWKERLGHAMVGRCDPSGYGAPGWPLDLANNGFTPKPPVVLSDGSAGAIVTFDENGTLAPRRVTANGGSVAHWPSTGALVVENSFSILSLASATDGAHGMIFGWTSNTIGPQQISAQRVDRFGAVGSPEPAITGIADVAADQGGHVRLAWNASYLDSDPYYAVGSYYIWRQTPASLAAAAVRRGARWVDDPAAAGVAPDPTSGRLFRHDASSAFAWEFVASQPANGSTQYTYVAPTTRDSMSVANPRTAFMVEARWTGGMAFWDSAPDSGYSVDNLAPAAPAQLAAQWYSGTSVLHWLPNTESDLYGYRVYRGTTSTFTPSPGNRIASPPDTGYVDAAGAAYWYKVSAVDIHGNESPFATVLPQGVTGLPPGEGAPRLALAVASENPFRGDAVLRFDLTRSGPVRLALYDAAGRLVREVAVGPFAAGEWLRDWDGRDRAGRAAPSGLYFVRLEAEGHRIMRKLALLR